MPENLPNFDTCSADAAGLEYLPVGIRLPESWMSGRFEVQTSASTPPGLGRLGFFFQAGSLDTPCSNGAWSTGDSFEASNMGQSVITGYVVLDRAVTTSTPQGRPDVFRSLTLRVSNVRLSGRPAVIGSPTAGALCPGTPDALCASLG